LNKALVLALVSILTVFPLGAPVLAGQSITVTLDVPHLNGSAQPPSGRPDTQSNGSDTSGETVRRAVDSATIGRVGVITAQKASIYRSRSSSRILATCGQGTPIGIVGEKGDWYGVLMIDSSVGWIRKSAAKLLNYDIVTTRRNGSPAANGAGGQIVQAALRYTGVPYVWGGNSWNGLDCSGFVKAVYGNFGVNLPRVSRDQANVGDPVAWDDLQAGDRLYFACKNVDIDHTGIYIGNGLFIHASSRRGGVAVDNLTDGFYARSLVAARRS